MHGTCIWKGLGQRVNGFPYTLNRLKTCRIINFLLDYSACWGPQAGNLTPLLELEGQGFFVSRPEMMMAGHLVVHRLSEYIL